MPNQSLFGHIVAKFSDQQENLATESLHYILEQHSARDAFLRFVAQIAPGLGPITRFETQSGKDKSARPDMVGKDANGHPVLVVEAKFWAGLTAQQPVAYINNLPEDQRAILLFIAPEKRLTTLWPELVSRCKDAGLELTTEAPDETAWQLVRLTAGHTLALTSWRSLLAYLLQVAQAENQTEVVSDIRQLQGLCDYMDATAFLPLQSEELTASTGTRIMQYCQLVDDITERLVAEGIASIKGLRATSIRGAYLRYMRIHGFGCWMSFSTALWSERRSTPLWFSVKGPDWQPSSEARERLQRLEMEVPPRLIIMDDHVVVPLYLPLGAEKAHVVEALLAQVKEIAGLLA